MATHGDIWGTGGTQEDTLKHNGTRGNVGKYGDTWARGTHGDT